MGKCLECLHRGQPSAREFGDQRVHRGIGDLNNCTRYEYFKGLEPFPSKSMEPGGLHWYLAGTACLNCWRYFSTSGNRFL